jgi:hypothetical protein
MRGSRETTKSKRGHAPQRALAVWHGVAWHGGKLVIWDLLFLGGVVAICLVDGKCGVAGGMMSRSSEFLVASQQNLETHAQDDTSS